MKLFGVYKETYDGNDELQKIIVAVFRGEDKANKYKDYISVEQGRWFGVEEIQTADDWIPGGYMVGTVSIKYTLTPNFAARTSKIDESRILFKKRIEPLYYTVNENLSRIVDKMNEGVYNLAALKECLK